MTFQPRHLILRLVAVLSLGGSVGAAPLKVEKEDSIVILGNTFAERMQLFGYFETFLHCRFPDHRLRVRNMGWSADEVDKQIRPQNFPNLHEDLESLGADLLFLCFGFNESFAGRIGLPHFEIELDRFVKNLLARKFNGESPPRIVIVSPIAFENLGDHPSDAVETNRNLDLYSNAAARVAMANNVQFLDLYTPTEAWLRNETGLTCNGVHLTERGSFEVSRMMAKGLELLPEGAIADPSVRGGGAEALRRAVYEKNHHFFAWWHPPNAFYIYGGRRKSQGAMHLAREREHRKLLIDASDRDLWAMKNPAPHEVWSMPAVGGKPVWFPTPKSRAIPGVANEVEAQWEMEGDGPPEKHLRSPEEQLRMFKIADGYQVNLFASELRFPMANPFAIHFDAEGRLWVANSPTWPHSLPGKQPTDSIIVLEDEDRDGVADKHTVFLKNMRLIHGFALGDGGAYVAQVPHLIFAKDTDDDGRADWVRTLLHGFGAEDAEHAMNNFRWSPGGSLYFSQGIFYNTQVETPYGPQRVRDAAVFRYTPREHRLEIPVSHAFWNPYGKVFDRWGRGILLDASAGQYYPMDVISTPYAFPKSKERTDHLSFAPGGAIAAGCEFVSSRQFPPEVQGRFVVNHCEGDVGVHWYDLETKGSIYKATRRESLATCTDRTFRPVAMAWGADGALYVADFYTHIFENVNFSKRHPGRDHGHGRIWRISHRERAMLKPAAIQGRPVVELLDLLKAHEASTRDLVRSELRNRDVDEVLSAMARWVHELDDTDPEHAHHLVETLWVSHGMGIADKVVLDRLLESKNPEARMAATQMLGFWPSGFSNHVVDDLRKRAQDDDPRVRLHVVLAAGRSTAPGARALLDEVKKFPMDPGLEYAVEETVKFLDKTVESGTASIVELIDQFEKGENRKAAAAGLRAARTQWPADRLGAFADKLIAYLESVPIGRRDSSEFMESMALARELAATLGNARGDALNADLDRLGVSMFLLRPIPGQLRFDRARLIVRAGAKAGILFENNDLMPHNLVLVEPGALDEVGNAADRMLADPRGLSRGYVPDSDKILWSSKLLMPRENQKIEFKAPTEAGEYPFICTYPGHWRIMRGVLVVTAPR